MVESRCESWDDARDDCGELSSSDSSLVAVLETSVDTQNRPLMDT